MNIKNGIVLIICLASFGVAQLEGQLLSLWPSLVALVSVILLKSALGGLFLGVAYEDIKDRKGKMVDGIFVKEE